MLIKNLIYILQSENYDISRFLKYAYTHYCWWDLEKRQKIKWTSKAILLCIVSLILSIALLIITFLNLQIFAAMIIAVIIILSLPLIIALSLALILPIDIAAKKRILKKAKNILEKKRAENKLIVIGIAGSFGKTSAKEILYAILKEKFETVKTPENINTDLGVANFIIEKLGNEEIFIVEMGAHHRGDIQILCDLVRPDYSMLTGVGYSHLERFGSFDSLIEEKFVLPQNTRKISVLNADSDLINNYQNKLKLPGTKNVSKSMASEIKTKNNFEGIEFCVDGEKIESRLLGIHNSTLILMCAEIAKELGMTMQEIKKAVKKIKPFSHRLEPIYNSASNVWVIDDSYNGNFDGIKSGIEVLSRAGGRKIVITPGLVELGEKSRMIHNEIGTLYAKNVDLVLLIKSNAAQYIIEGMEKNNFRAYSVYDTTEEAHNDLKNVLKNGDTIIFQNDWTDNYF